MRVLLVGSGVIGSVYAGQLGLVGHEIAVSEYGARDKDIIEHGIRLRDTTSGRTDTINVKSVASSSEEIFDIVIVAVRVEQLSGTFDALKQLVGVPHIVFFGNNPDGHAAIPDDLPASIQLAFPGIGGAIVDGVVDYVLVDQQPTALEANSNEKAQAISAALHNRNFPTQEISDMDGWLAHHAVFISCMSMAILKHGGDTANLGNDRTSVRKMCQAITEGFRMLKKQNIGGAPKNLSVLHSKWLLPIAVAYWGKLLRSPKGELYFGAHARHSAEEIYALANWVRKEMNGHGTRRLLQLLTE